MITPLQKMVLEFLKIADHAISADSVYLHIKSKYSVTLWHVQRTLGQLQRESFVHRDRAGWVITECGLYELNFPV